VQVLLGGLGEGCGTTGDAVSPHAHTSSTNAAIPAIRIGTCFNGASVVLVPVRRGVRSGSPRSSCPCWN